MPPWHADPQYGHFINDARLSDHDKQLIVFDERGTRLSEYALPGGGESRQFLAHPAGKKLVVLTSQRLLFVEVPG